MTTSKSPPQVLRAQAHKIADSLKRAVAGEKIADDPLGKIEASKARGYVDFAIVMDDKILKIKVPWKTIGGAGATTVVRLHFRPDGARPSMSLTNAWEKFKSAIGISPATVDRTARQLSGGRPETPDHRELDARTGQQKGYVVLAPEERAKGFVRPVRLSYIHNVCGAETFMARDIAETYARDPGFYGGTFCTRCRAHFPLAQFTWSGTIERLGT